MNIFELARIITERQGGSMVDLIDNAVKIRNFLDLNPKFIEYLSTDKKSLNSSQKRYLQERMARIRGKK